MKRLSDVQENIFVIIIYGVSMLLYLLPGAGFFAWSVALIGYLLKKDSFTREYVLQAFILYLSGGIFNVLIYILQLAIVPVTYVQYANVTLSAMRTFLSGIINVIYIMGITVIFSISIISIIKAYYFKRYNIYGIDKVKEKFRVILNKILDEENEDKDNNIDNNMIVEVGELLENGDYKSRKSVKKLVDSSK